MDQRCFCAVLLQSNSPVLFSVALRVATKAFAATTIFAAVSCAVPDAAAADPATVVVPVGDDPVARVPATLDAGDPSVVADAMPEVAEAAACVAVAPTVGAPEAALAAPVVGEGARVGAGGAVGVAEPPQASSKIPIAEPPGIVRCR